MNKLIGIIIALFFGATLFAPSAAYADDNMGNCDNLPVSECPVPPDPCNGEPCPEPPCEGANCPPDGCNTDYYLAVINNFDEALIDMTEQKENWREAHNRVADNLVLKQEEYADLVTAHRQLTDRYNWQKSRVSKLRAQLKNLRAEIRNNR